MATLAAVTPAFTVGALTGPTTAEFGVSTASLGLALALFFAATALGSPVSARIVERIGAARQLAAAVAIAGAAMVGMGAVSSLATLAGLLFAGGLANSLVAPAAGLILGSEVSERRLSLASGLVQAALAAPPLSAGLVVRFLAEPYGWRTALSVGGVIVALSALVSVLARKSKQNREAIPAPRSAVADERATSSGSKKSRRVLPIWALGAAFGTVGVTATASFLVPIATGSGFTTAAAGSLALAAGALAAVVRIVAGILADLRPRANLATVAGMMLVGSAGLVVISLAGTTATFLVGALLLVAGLWGWNGLLVASAVRLLPGSPARSLGSLQVGFFCGATLAPVLFGALSTAAGIRGALLAVAAMPLFAVGEIAAGERSRRRGEAKDAIGGKRKRI